MVAPEKLNILYVEDDEDDVLLFRELLHSADLDLMNLHWESDPHAALLMAKSGTFDLCILDYHLGSMSGLELLNQLKTSGADMPILFLTGAYSENLDMKLMELGASDYLEKSSLTPTLLRRSILYSWTNHQNALKSRQIKSLKEVQKLAGSIAHEFSQPLQILQIGLDIYNTKEPDQTWTRNSFKALERLRALTDQIRKLTQLKTRSYLNTEILDLEESSSVTHT